jgi:damage-control phosphatase, subfamily III
LIQIHFHGKKFAWFVSGEQIESDVLAQMSSVSSLTDVTKKDWSWLLSICVFGHLFKTGSPGEHASLKKMGERWKQYEKEGRWVYESHPFWITGYTFVSL